MRISRKELEAWIDGEHFVSVLKACQKWGLTEDKACRLLRRLWDEGTLLPVNVAFFGRPVDDLPPRMDRESSDWYRGREEKVMEFIENQEIQAIGAYDLMQAFEWSYRVSRNVLKSLVNKGRLVSRESAFGGVFGKRPIMYGVDRETLEQREAQYEAKEGGKKAKRKKRVGRKKSKEELVDIPLVPLHADEWGDLTPDEHTVSKRKRS